MSSITVLPGAESWSASGGTHGVLVLHGSGLDRVPGPGGDIAEPGREELAYAEAPVAGLLSLLDAADALQESLARIAMPALDFDAHEIEQRTVAFARHVTA